MEELARYTDDSHRFGSSLTDEDFAPLKAFRDAQVEIVRRKKLRKPELKWRAFKIGQRKLYNEMIEGFSGSDSPFAEYLVSEDNWIVAHIILGIITEARKQPMASDAGVYRSGVEEEGGEEAKEEEMGLESLNLTEAAEVKDLVNDAFGFSISHVNPLLVAFPCKIR